MKNKNFKIWLKENYEKSLFGRYEFKNWPEKGNWSKKELYEYFKKQGKLIFKLIK